MSETWKSSRLAVTTTAGVIYVCPSATTAIVSLCQAAIVDVTTGADLTLYWTDASASGAITNLVKGVTIPPMAALNPIGGRLALEAGDTLYALASANGKIELSLTVLELA